MAPTSSELLQWFETGHMQEYLKETVNQYRRLAEFVIANTAPSAEQTLAIRFLEQSKDYAVRAAVLRERRNNP